MPRWHDKYDQMRPSVALLSDHAVLVQAWKKAHTYIRLHNWYADSLELDISTIRLRKLVSEWSDLFRTGNVDDLVPRPMRLVPAPKAGTWKVEKGWQPDKGDSDVKLRPLSHLAIRDQTLAMAALICLADCIETAQGNPEPPVEKRNRHQVVSYGHRLVCTWTTRGTARFRWGSANLYRKFFADYQSFVQRPERMRAECIESGRKWAIVQADLSQFYDRIRRDDLIEKVRELAEQSYGNVDKRFVRILERLFSWRWHPEDAESAVQQTRSPDTNGLPQGLAASGFFSNAYMLAFDQSLVSIFDRSIPNCAWRIVDYCRYVDDMRFVIDLGETDSEQFRTDFEGFLQKTLDDTAPGLRLNVDKTTIKFSHSHPSHAPLADAMQAIQTELSGPLDVETARQAIEMLDGLLASSNQHRIPLQPKGTGQDDVLMRMFSVEPDVRTDTLERFVAHRWRRVFRSLRVMADAEGLVDTSLNVGRALLDRRAETFATELMRRWIHDPSNVRLLRVSLDIFPSSKHLQAVVRLLELHLNRTTQPNARTVCSYVAAELLRAGATETGFVNDDDELPTDSDILEYRQMLVDFAKRLLSSTSIPWYVQQQSLLLLGVMGETADIHVRSEHPNTLYAALHQVLAGTWPENDVGDEMSVDDVIPLIIIGHRISNDAVTSSKLLAKLIDELEVADAEEVLIDIITEDESLFRAVLEILPTASASFWHGHLAAKGYTVSSGVNSWQPVEGSESFYPLLEIIGSRQNPFLQETCTLRLCEMLTKEWGTPSARQRNGVGPLTPSRIEVKCPSWKLLADPTRKLGLADFELRITSTSVAGCDKRYEVPDWCEQSHKWKIEIGQVLRAAILGQADYSQNYVATRVLERIGKYRGIRSSWFMRKHGLYNERRALGSRFLPVSPWMSELLWRLLRWPGTQNPHRLITLPDNFRASDLLAMLNTHLLELSGQYCRASEMPAYTFPAELWNREGKGLLKVAVVQSVMPHHSDFDAHGIQLDQPAYRMRHRRHLTSMLRVLRKILDIREGYKQEPERIDLVVFPELAVHVDDVPILIRFADAAKLIVFCGLVFHSSPDDPGEIINSGLWILPVHSPLGRAIYLIEQGKWHLTPFEVANNITPYRPCQWIIEGRRGQEEPWRITAAICFDATDLRLATDMRNQTDGFIVSALNQDVATFDTMVAALHYHMYQHVILVNSGEYGGTTAQAPYRAPWKKLLVHHHGSDQALVSVLEVDLLHFRGQNLAAADGGQPNNDAARKSPPAGFAR